VPIFTTVKPLLKGASHVWFAAHTGCVGPRRTVPASPVDDEGAVDGSHAAADKVSSSASTLAVRINQQSQSTISISNLNQQSEISIGNRQSDKSAVNNPQSAIVTEWTRVACRQ